MIQKFILVISFISLNLVACGSGGGGNGGGGGGGGTITYYDVTITVTGDNNANGICDAPLDDLRMPFNGDEIIYYFNSLSPVPSASAPQMTWDNNTNAYAESIADVTAAELNNFWVVVAQPDPGAAASPGSWSPVFGVFITITDQNGKNCTSLLVHYELIGEDPDGNYLYAAKILNLNSATGCINQLEDNRMALFGL